MTLEKLKNLKLPDKPGVYSFYKETPSSHKATEGQGKILYIGKATSLKSRVRSYFSGDLIETRGAHMVDMVFAANSIKWQETESVLEALILEANFIKKYQPYYNTKEKDDKSFNYVCISKEELPRIFIVRGKNLEPKMFKSVYGPYPNGSQLKIALELIRKIFPFLDEKSRISGTYEFYRQIKLIPEQKEMLLQNIKNIKLLLEGKKKSIFKNLEKEMKVYAKAHEFEKAGELKRQLFALKHINDIALLKLEPSTYNQKPNFRIEAYDIAHMSGKNMVGVMVVIEDGEVAKNEYRKFKIRTQSGANDAGALKEVIERRLGHTEWRYPDLIVADGNAIQYNAAREILKKYELTIPVVAVTKDDRHKAKSILGESGIATKYKNQILLSNSEAHRFSITYHKNMRAKNFLNK